MDTRQEPGFSHRRGNLKNGEESGKSPELLGGHCGWATAYVIERERERERKKALFTKKALGKWVLPGLSYEAVKDHGAFHLFSNG